MHKLPTVQGISWLQCPNHLSPSTVTKSPRVEALLRSFGMDELMPLFLAVRINNDEDFELLSLLDEEERLHLFKGIDVYRPRPFQEMMLNLVLRSLKAFDSR